MQVRILGNRASISAWGCSACLLVNSRIAFDTGGLVSHLDMVGQLAIDHVFLTHAHLDHAGELAFLLDNIAAIRPTPLQVWAPGAVIEQVQTHLFNGQIWPDFSRIIIDGRPVVIFRSLNDDPLTIAGLTIRWAQTNHPVPSFGYLVASDGNTFLYTGDTGPTEAIWELARNASTLRVVFVETAFPDRHQELALRSGHLTPRLLGRELKKLSSPEVAIKIMHVKSVYYEEILDELQGLPWPCQVLVGGESFTLN